VDPRGQECNQTILPLWRAAALIRSSPPHIKSPARPGRNVTGLTILNTELTGKRLELLKEVVPRLSRLAVTWNPQQPGQQLAYKESQVAAQTLKLTVTSIKVRNREDIEKLLAGVGKEHRSALGASRSCSLRKP
jgi:putative tryptophan/tyrosine transport system substrate-binding protein